jgi:hypothetical protein
MKKSVATHLTFLVSVGSGGAVIAVTVAVDKDEVTVDLNSLIDKQSSLPPSLIVMSGLVLASASVPLNAGRATRTACVPSRIFTAHDVNVVFAIGPLRLKA